MVEKISRSLRVAQLMKREIAIIIKFSINDPRIDFIVSVTDVKLSIDLSYAKIFLVFITKNNKQNIKKVMKIFEKASTYIRFLLSKKIQLRKSPILSFHYDDSFIYATKISNIISNVIKQDQKTL